MSKSSNERAPAYVRNKRPRKQYRWIGIEKGGFVDRYIEKTYQTSLCKSREEAIAVLIEHFDENWEFLDEGTEGTVVEPARQTQREPRNLR